MAATPLAIPLRDLLAEQHYSPLRPAYTLLKREVLRFAVISIQTVFTPLMTASLYLLVFGVSLGKQISLFPHVSYLQFVVSGLILMGVAQNSYQNSSSSLFMARYLGYIVDFLVAPLSPSAFIMAYTVAAMMRGLVVGATIIAVSCFFTELPWPDPLGAVLLLLVSSFLFAQFGIITGIICHSFDSLAMFTNFILQPLIYLGGLFYPVSLLPPFWRSVSYVNPLLYMIDGLRGCVLGQSDIPYFVCLGITSTLSILLFFIASLLLHRGKSLA
jgi:ABC-2 type transport system permease protein